MSIVAKKNRILILLLVVEAMLFALGLWGYSKLSEGRIDKHPVIRMIVDRDDHKQMEIQGHPVGADLVHNWDGGQKEQYYIPSLHGVWQLDEPYAQSTILLNEDAEYISLYCAHETVSGFLKQPHSIYAIRFDQSVVSVEPGESADWSEGVEVPLVRHGETYRIEKPLINSVYVVRTVWDSGVLEHAWLVLEK